MNEKGNVLFFQLQFGTYLVLFFQLQFGTYLEDKFQTEVEKREHYLFHHLQIQLRNVPTKFNTVSQNYVANDQLWALPQCMCCCDNKNEVTTLWYLVGGISRFPKVPKSGVRVDVDGHASQEDHMTNEETRIPKPRNVILKEVSEVAALHVAISGSEE